MWMFWGNLKTYWTNRLFCCPVLRILLTSSGFLKAWLTVESTYYFITQSLIKERKKKSNNIWRNKNKKTLYPSVVIIRFSAGISFQRSWIHVNKFWLINLTHPPTHRLFTQTLGQRFLHRDGVCSRRTETWRPVPVLLFHLSVVLFPLLCFISVLSLLSGYTATCSNQKETCSIRASIWFSSRLLCFPPEEFFHEKSFPHFPLSL